MSTEALESREAGRPSGQGLPLEAARTEEGPGTGWGGWRWIRSATDLEAAQARARVCPYLDLDGDRLGDGF